MIKPEPGRVVHIYIAGRKRNEGDQPLAGSIAYVHNDRLINVGAIDKHGNAVGLVNVPLLQPDDALPENHQGPYAEWMPFQKQQHQGGAKDGRAPAPRPGANVHGLGPDTAQPAPKLDVGAAGGNGTPPANPEPKPAE